MISICRTVLTKKDETEYSHHSSAKNSLVFFPVDGACHPFYFNRHSILNPNRTCPVVQPWIYGYDAIAEAEKALKGKGLFKNEEEYVPQDEIIKGKF